MANCVWFILKECGVHGIPAFNKIRDMKLGNINVEKMIKKLQLSLQFSITIITRIVIISFQFSS